MAKAASASNTGARKKPPTELDRQLDAAAAALKHAATGHSLLAVAIGAISLAAECAFVSSGRNPQAAKRYLRGLASAAEDDIDDNAIRALARLN